MSRRQLFHAADLARALKVAQGAGLTITRVEIEPSGKTVIVTHRANGDTDQNTPDAVLEAVRKKDCLSTGGKSCAQGTGRQDRIIMGRLSRSAGITSYALSPYSWPFIIASPRSPDCDHTSHLPRRPNPPPSP